MYIFFTILIILICVLLIGIVLIQNPKGGGLSAGFGGDSQQLFGARKTTDFLEKGTWYLAIALLVISLGSTAFIERTTEVKSDEITSEVVDINKDKPNTPPPGAGLPGGLPDASGNE